MSLFFAELCRTWIMFRRYPIPTVSFGIITFLTFIGIFLGAQYLAGSASLLGSHLDAIIIGYIVWTLSLTALVDISLNLQYDAQAGTIEHIYLSPYSPAHIYLFRAFAQLTITLLITLVVAALIMVITRNVLPFKPLALAGVLMTLVSAYGFSLIFAGLTLIFKRLGGLFGLLQTSLLLIVIVPFEAYGSLIQGASVLLPVAPGMALLRQVFGESGVSALTVSVAASNSILYFLIGMFVFNLADRHTRYKGTVRKY